MVFIISIISMQLKFHKSIYKKTAVMKTINEFRHLADINADADNIHYLVNINHIDPEIKNNFAEEFGNYVLYLMNARNS